MKFSVASERALILVNAYKCWNVIRFAVELSDDCVRLQHFELL